MYFDMHDVKFAMYWMLGIMGVIMLCLALYEQNAAEVSADPVSYTISIAVLGLVGCGMLFFCLETFLLRNEDDIWR